VFLRADSESECWSFGITTTYGEDFFETFAPTGKFPSLLALLVLVIYLKLPICQFDLKRTFLFAPLQEEIFIKTPEGSKRTAPYLKLVKSLCELKQAPKNCPSISDPCLFVHKEKNSFIFFHVDDLIVVAVQLHTATNEDHEEFLKLN
ncbi:hypothetical protein VP01_3643g2, partial [Puccinia sorghi]